MDDPALKDISWRRISACPVHFLWDGRGVARRLVRFGFAAIILAMSFKTADRLWPHLGLDQVAAPALMFGGLLWGYGQLKSVWLTFCQKGKQKL